MAASRITFAIGDLMSEIRALVTAEAPPVEIHLDEATYGAVVGEIENHYSQQLTPDPAYKGVGVRFGGVLIAMAGERTKP